MRKSSKKKTPEIQYWYPIKNVGQLTFEGKMVIVPAPQEGHIYYNGRLICKQSMERLKNECGAKSHKMVTVRIAGVKICHLCQEGYKKNESLAWAHWVKPPELKHPAAPKINPELLEENIK